MENSSNVVARRPPKRGAACSAIDAQELRRVGHGVAAEAGEVAAVGGQRRNAAVERLGDVDGVRGLRRA